jgi:ribosomal protein S2
MNIPVVSIGNTDCSLRDLSYPIVANEGSTSSIKAIFDILKTSFQK